MKYKNPEICERCSFAHRAFMYDTFWYCSHPNAGSEELDVHAYRIDLEGKPDWCPITKMNKFLETATKEERDLLYGLLKLFRAENLLEIEGI